MVYTKLADLIAVLDLRALIKFDVCSFANFKGFEGKLRDFTNSMYYRVYSCDPVTYLKITGDFIHGYKVFIKVTPPTE